MGTLRERHHWIGNIKGEISGGHREGGERKTETSFDLKWKGRDKWRSSRRG